MPIARGPFLRTQSSCARNPQTRQLPDPVPCRCGQQTPPTLPQQTTSKTFAQSYVEPFWETGKNQWWRFHQAQCQPWGMAGIWNTWLDKETGEVVESYSMVTVNADLHPLLSRMHRPDPERPPHQQDKRAVVPLDPEAYETWLKGSIEEASAVLVLPPVERFDASVEGVRPHRSSPIYTTGELF